MPTLPLLTPTTHPDGWRQVRAPGGYESWVFSATCDDGKTHVTVGLHLGHPQDPAYARRYRLYRAFPTRVRPPVPAEYASVTFELGQGNMVALRTLCAEPSAEITATRENVRIGSNHIETAADGAIHVRLRGQSRERTITADLVFRPKLVATCAEIVDGPHHVAIVAPICEVDGELHVFESGTPQPRVHRVSGVGHHEHRYGTRMPAESQVAGGTLRDGSAVLLHAFGPRVHVTAVSAERCRQVQLEAANPHRAPAAIGADEIEITTAPLLDKFFVVYDVSVDSVQSRIYCESFEPVRSLPGSFLKLLGR